MVKSNWFRYQMAFLLYLKLRQLYLLPVTEEHQRETEQFCPAK